MNNLHAEMKIIPIFGTIITKICFICYVKYEKIPFMSLKRVSILSLLICSCLAACRQEPVFPIEPHITYLSVDVLEVKENRDPMWVEVHFTDGDGDLGDLEDDTQGSLIVIDNRTQFPDSLRTFYYRIPDLTPDTRNPSIQGKISVRVPPTIITPGLSQDYTTYTLYLYDRGGHKSNEVTSDSVRIIR